MERFSVDLFLSGLENSSSSMNDSRLDITERAGTIASGEMYSE